jgi:hypothetical protein
VTELPRPPDAYQYGYRLVSHDALMAMSKAERHEFLRRLSDRWATRLKGRPAQEIAEAVRDWGKPLWFDET